MKSQIKKIFAVLVCVCLMFSVVVISASAAESSATISFANKAQRTSFDASKQVWEQNGIKVTNEKASSTSSVADYANPARFYKNSTLKVEYTSAIKKIEFTANSSSYATSLKKSIGAEATANDSVVTFTPAAAATSFTFTLSDGQARVNSLVVYYEGASVTPPPVNQDPPADSTLTIVEALALGETKEHNEYTSGKYYVEGVITSISNTQYGNMNIKDANGNSLTIYGSYDADGTNRFDAMATQPAAGDTVKLYGIIGKYNTTPQMKNAWIVAHTPGTPPVNNDPAADTVLTVKEAIDLGASKDHNVYTTNKYYVTGEITEIYNEQYGNMKIKDAEGNILTIYGTYNEDGSVRFDEIAEKPAVGDTVTVYGIIGKYNNVAQMKNGWFKDAPAGDNNQGGGNIEGGNNTGAGTGADTNTGANTNNNNTTKPIPVTGDSNNVVVTLISIVGLAVVATFVVSKFCKN
ncbi:MAG: hypothetical protein E7560_04135 [Ruminococcaceae bacterium]|nr:hypothetical protein [Oscillospiraceae bacterium]